MNRPTPAPAPLSPVPADDSIAGEEDPGAAVDAPAPPPHRNDKDKPAERSPSSAADNATHPPALR